MPHRAKAEVAQRVANENKPHTYICTYSCTQAHIVCLCATLTLILAHVSVLHIYISHLKQT